MRVETLSLTNVGPFDQFQLTFQKCPPGKAEIHLLVGENGSGKSSVLYALANLFRNFDSGPQPHDISPRVRLEETPALSAVIDGETYFERTKKISRGNYTNDAHYPQPRFFKGKRTFAAFAYSGARSFAALPQPNAEPAEFEPLRGALSFTKPLQGLAREQWKRDARWTAQGHKRIEQALSTLIDLPVRIHCRRDSPNMFLKVHGQRLLLDALPGGMSSIISWVTDLLMRLERMEWHDRTPIFQRRFLLLLDEIDIHLHPRWQRRILPALQTLFPNAQIIASTHSPFVAASISDAWVHLFTAKNGKALLKESVPAKAGYSNGYVLENLFGIESDFDVQTEREVAALLAAIRKVRDGKGTLVKDVLPRAEVLARKSAELATLAGYEVNQLRQRLKERKR